MTGTKVRLLRTTLAQLTLVLALSVMFCIFTLRLASLTTAIANAVSGSETIAAARPPVAPVLSDDQVNRLRALSDCMDVMADNLSNAETTGFKRRLVDVGAALHIKHDQSAVRVPVRYDMSQGGLESTGVNTDVAIQGNGFFRIKMPRNIGDGTGYTRNGSLFTNKNGDLVVGPGDGYELIPPTNIPPGATDVEIAQDGTVQYTPKGGNGTATAGQIKLYQFNGEQSLAAHDASIFLETPQSGPPMVSNPGDNGAGQLQQGFLEESNVDSVKEQLALSKANQMFAVCTQSLKTADQAKLIIASIRN